MKPRCGAGFGFFALQAIAWTTLASATTTGTAAHHVLERCGRQTRAANLGRMCVRLQVRAEVQHHAELGAEQPQAQQVEQSSGDYGESEKPPGASIRPVRNRQDPEPPVPPAVVSQSGGNKHGEYCNATGGQVVARVPRQPAVSVADAGVPISLGGLGVGTDRIHESDHPRRRPRTGRQTRLWPAHSLDVGAPDGRPRSRSWRDRGVRFTRSTALRWSSASSACRAM